ncbi:MAG: 2OG-Fe(II) oxygenase [Pseudomonadota bacterium]
MDHLLDLDRFPLDRPESDGYRLLVEACKDDIDVRGMFNLAGFVRADALARCVAEIKPVLADNAYTHRQLHNIYFQNSVAGLASDHPALLQAETSNRKICADQIQESLLLKIYEWPALAGFLAKVMDKDALHPMDDPLARVNVMTYADGEALNWHFDRSEFTTTLLLQAPETGGVFEYRSDLRSDEDPNYDGVAKLVLGMDDAVRTVALAAGTLNVFKGKNTAHRVTPVEGDTNRTIAVFSYYEAPGVRFSAEDQRRFYGRVA